MSYTINLTNGNVFAVIPDGTINSTSSMTLIGKNYAGYGQFLDDNFIHLLESGANGTAPTAPLNGQLWFNTTTGLLNVYRTSGFKPIAATTSASSAPSNNATGDLWFDTTNTQLNVYNGTSWTLVGPTYTGNTGLTGAIPAVIVDNSSAQHVVTELYVANTIVGIVSKDATFTPQTTISGFGDVSPGIQIANAIGVLTPTFTGIATNALSANNSAYLGGLPASSYITSVTAAGTVTLQGILNANASGVGNVGNASVPFNTFFGTANNANYLGNVPAASYLTNVSGTIAVNNVLNGSTSATGTVGNVTVPFGGVYAASASVNNIYNSGTSGTGTIGNASAPFATVYARATTALYADLAERFAADEVYDAGTVVELGGSAEITKTTAELSDSVFGVISTRAAYLMNGGAGTDATHPPVAMTGRVPVKVTGTVLKGDRLVSAGNGIARSAQPGEATAFNVIGRALESKMDTGLGTVEAIVTIK